MTYRWEPTTPLDRILETGFKRMDEAVEGVIEKYPTPTYHKFVADDPISPATRAALLQNELLFRNQRAMTEMARRQGAGLHGIGDQSAFGSPLYELGAAYRNAFGGGS